MNSLLVRSRPARQRSTHIALQNNEKRKAACAPLPRPAFPEHGTPMSSKPISRPPPPPPPPSSAARQPPPQEWSVRACSIFGIPVFLHFSLPLFLGFLCLTHARLGAIGIIFAVCYAAVLFLTVTVHEFGHCLAAQKVGCCAERVLLWPLGGLATCVMPTNPRDRMIVAAAGPATHLPMTLCWLILSATTGYPIRFWSPAVPLEASSLYHWLCWVGLYINVLLFVFNLLVPARPPCHTGLRARRRLSRPHLLAAPRRCSLWTALSSCSTSFSCAGRRRREPRASSSWCPSRWLSCWLDGRS